MLCLCKRRRQQRYSRRAEGQVSTDQGGNECVQRQRQDRPAPAAEGGQRALAAPVLGRGGGKINYIKYWYPIVCESAVRL